MQTGGGAVSAYVWYEALANMMGGRRRCIKKCYLLQNHLADEKVERKTAELLLGVKDVKNN